MTFSQLSPAAKAVVVGRLHQLFQARHPETVPGRNGKGRGKAVNQVYNFGLEVGPKIGLSWRYVYLLSRWHKVLGDDVMQSLVGTTLDNSKHIEALLDLPTSEAREAYIRTRGNKLRKQEQHDLTQITKQMETIL